MGICCIDEFNLIKKKDLGCIHECLEQQSLSIAKAGIVCKLETRSVVVAAMNVSNKLTNKCKDASKGLGLDSSLISRFDLVLVLEDEYDDVWDEKVADHILNLSSANRQPLENNIWPVDKLKKYFCSIRKINPYMTEEANSMLNAYFRHCRKDPKRNQATTSIRLLQCLRRLATAHARLLQRNYVNAIDVAVIIRLLESSYGFGRVLKPYNLICEELPLGPSNEDISAIFLRLDLGNYVASPPPAPINAPTLVVNEPMECVHPRPSCAAARIEDGNVGAPIRTENASVTNSAPPNLASIHGRPIQLRNVSIPEPTSEDSNISVSPNLASGVVPTTSDLLMSQALDDIEEELFRNNYVKHNSQKPSTSRTGTL